MSTPNINKNKAMGANYSDYFQTFYEYDFSYRVSGIYESSISRFLILLKDKYPNFSIYSLPSLISGGKDKSKVTLELGFKVGWEAFNSMGVDDDVNAAGNNLTVLNYNEYIEKGYPNRGMSDEERLKIMRGSLKAKKKSKNSGRGPASA